MSSKIGFSFFKVFFGEMFFESLYERSLCLAYIKQLQSSLLSCRHLFFSSKGLAVFGPSILYMLLLVWKAVAIFIFLKIFVRIFGRTLPSVSYTHLDVYKRQRCMLFEICDHYPHFTFYKLNSKLELSVFWICPTLIKT